MRYHLGNQPKQVGYHKIFLMFLVLASSVVLFYSTQSRGEDELTQEPTQVQVRQASTTNEEYVQTAWTRSDSVPVEPVSMEQIKTKGCVADSILNGIGKGTDSAIRMINRSECGYLHRSIETWLQAPDFEIIKENKEKFTKDGLIFGMFIAEAIDKKSELYYPAENREFEFDRMCKPGTDNTWGEHTCIPSLEKAEYRKYVRYITEQAMDLGVQSFMFGQVFYQDNMRMPVVGQVIQEMREYAAYTGRSIVIGAQTNDITDEGYLRQFDFIEGGVGLKPNGSVEDGPCFSRWWQQPGDWCWALLWNKQFSTKANNVLLHLDWSGKRGDDMSTFARMNQEQRLQSLNMLYHKFTRQGNGFMMPFVAVLPTDNGGCFGKRKGYYTPDQKYSCQDEDGINAIMRKK